MGKSAKKQGKNRLDKYYHLAKEQGYRARSAYKLIQLNKKFDFLSQSEVVIDLCAAPGGWLQVASKSMPMDSILIGRYWFISGVDLVPIKPIAKAITIQADITTEQCRGMLKKHLRNKKADSVLHDGAPNVGSTWIQDAYSQSELVLKSLRLAVDFLKKGGTFVTKIFRSKDYNSLIWVFNQLFEKVEVTKPPSSRNESAEIFVVCSRYLAPIAIDPKFLDPQQVFKDIDEKKELLVNEDIQLKEKINKEPAKIPHIVAGFDQKIQATKKKAKAEGYDVIDANKVIENQKIDKNVASGMTLFKKIDLIHFLSPDQDPLKIFLNYNQISFDSEEAKKYIDHPLTTLAVKENLNDLKVLNRKDLKLLLKYRLKIQKEIWEENKKHLPEEEKEEIVVEEDMEDELNKILALKQDKEAKQAKKARAKKAKEILKLKLGMEAPDVELDSAHLPAIDIERIKKDDKLREADMDFENEVASSCDEDVKEYNPPKIQDFSDDEYEKELEESLNLLYQAKLSTKRSLRLQKLKDGNEELFTVPAAVEENDEDEVEPQVEESETEEPVLPSQNLSKNARNWFENPLFKDMKDVVPTSFKQSKKVKVKETTEKVKVEKEKEVEPEDSDSDSESDVEIEKPANKSKYESFGLENTQMMSLALKLVNGETNKHKLIDEGFNRYSFNDRIAVDGEVELPEWFVDNEIVHNKPPIESTKEGFEAVNSKKSKMKLNRRNIKKVVEAKTRKKLRVVKKTAKINKKLEHIVNDEMLTEAEKAKTVSKALSKGLKGLKKEKRPTLVVAKTKQHGRPAGIKGRYKMVDARMKKETRKMKSIREKKNKRK